LVEIPKEGGEEGTKLRRKQQGEKFYGSASIEKEVNE
jgi:hypothetical protein